MARTNNPDIFLVKDTYVARETKGGRRPSVWYLNRFTKPDLKELTTVGTVKSFTTKGNEAQGKAPRNIVVATVADVTPGTKHIITLPSGELHRVTIPVNV